MTLPSNVTTLTVTATLDQADGTPGNGFVYFTIPYDITDLAGKVIILHGVVRAPVVNGQMSQVLLCTDSPNTNPTGWTYSVLIQLNGGPDAVPFNVELPVAAGPTVDLAELYHTGPGTPAYATAPFGLLHSDNVWTGHNTFTQSPTAPDPTAPEQLATRNYVDAHSAGAGTVLTVNGKTGPHPVLNAADVEAVPVAVAVAKGDVLVATGPGTVVRLAAGTDAMVLVADSTAPTGLRWETLPAAPVLSVNDLTGHVTLTAALLGALNAAANLADLPNAGTARTNLGLRGAATVDIGTTAGTVAAGDDSRITGAIPETIVTAKGDILTATGPGAVARLPVGADTLMLAADSSSPTGLRWIAAPAGGGAFKGTWSSATAYAAGDTVVRNSRSYAAVQAGTNHLPAVPTQLLTATPATVDSGDGSAYELGVVINPTSDVRMTGAAFYKAPANTGTHIARLWQLGKNGVYYVVNQSTFTGETPSGWQTTPLYADLAAGGTYMLSYSVPNGHYSLDPHLFDAPVTVGSITAPVSAGLYYPAPGHVPENPSGTNSSYGIAPIWDEPNSAWWQETGDWQVLPAFPSAQEVAGAFLLAEIGVPGGVAALDGTSHLLVANLPPSVVQNTIVDAKGDLIVGTAPDTVARLAAGADGTALVADSTAPDGLRWTDPATTTGLWTPAHTGLAAATMDPRAAVGVTPAAGTVYLGALYIARPTAVTALLWGVATAGASPVAGSNWIALVDPAGAVLVSVNADSRITATGLFAETFATQNLTPGLYRVALLINAGTMPMVLGLSAVGADVANAGAAAPAVYPCAVNGTGLTTMPSSFDLTANVAAALTPFAAV